MTLDVRSIYQMFEINNDSDLLNNEVKGGLNVSLIDLIRPVHDPISQFSIGYFLFVSLERSLLQTEIECHQRTLYLDFNSILV